MQGVAVTADRGLLAALVEANDVHTAPELWGLMRQRRSDMELAAVRATLRELAEAGEIAMIPPPSGEALYCRGRPHHHHRLVCRECGLTVEVVGPSMAGWTDDLGQEHGFVRLNSTMDLLGLGPRCRSGEPS